MALRNIGRKGAAVAATIGLGALLVGCSTQPGAGFAGVATTAAPMPMSVTCEPNQRAVVRQVAANGGLQAQVQCESVGAPVGTTGSYGVMAPVAYAQAPAGQ